MYDINIHIKIRTHEKREQSIYCGMGIIGIRACLMSAPCCCCCFVEPMRAQGAYIIVCICVCM
jgi:hypothetical protein